MFNYSTQTLTEITPLKFINYGLSNQLNPIVWINKSTRNSDWLDCGNGGVLQLQTGGVSPTEKLFFSVLTKSNDESLIVEININDSKVTLNDVPIVSW